MTKKPKLMKQARNITLIATILILLAYISGCKKDSDLQSNNDATDTTSNSTTADYYVSPTGDDSNSGTIEKPFKTIAKAYSIATAGTLIYFREGKYQPTNTNAMVSISLNRGINGTSDKMIKFWAYPGEKPVIDLSSITYAGGTIWGILITGNYLHWKGFEVTGLPSIQAQYVHSAVMAKDCNNCIFENFIIHDNHGMGMVLAGNSNNNFILNSDAYNNQDPLTTADPYGNADGFHLGVVNNADVVNTIKNCRSWYNSDDGYDFDNNEGTLVLENCWAFWNGYKIGTTETAGDGVGFKLGKSEGSYSSIKRKLTTCIAAKNRTNGIDLNNGIFAVSLSYCNAYANGNYGMNLNKYDMKNELSNCISFDNGSSYNTLITEQSTITNCSWKGFSVSASDFESVDINQLKGERTSDFSLPTISFLKLTALSKYQYQ